jgi:hypothetical protein
MFFQPRVPLFARFLEQGNMGFRRKLERERWLVIVDGRVVDLIFDLLRLRLARPVEHGTPWGGR